MTFLAARTAPVPREGKGAMAIIGVPFDGTSTFRRGSRHGPAAIRWASQSIETYSPVLRRALEDVELFDAGDVDVAGAGVDGMRSAADAHLAALPSHAVPAVLGGEHTVTFPIVERLHRSYSDLAVLQLDAHTDLRDEYEGLAVSHATVMRRVADLVGSQSVVQIGTRAGTAGEFETARSLRFSSPALNMPAEIWSWLEQRPVYVTLDIDVIDPSDAPGTGNPEPEGIAARELLSFIRKLGGLRIVGFDVVEVSPPYDPSGRTAVLAATIVREAILVISARPL